MNPVDKWVYGQLAALRRQTRRQVPMAHRNQWAMDMWAPDGSLTDYGRERVQRWRDAQGASKRLKKRLQVEALKLDHQLWLEEMEHIDTHGFGYNPYAGANG